ncbi:MAG: glycosyltransferase family 2 protein [Candidatus Thorarchaeota archaeon]
MQTKISIICPVYNSHEIFKKQLYYIHNELIGFDFDVEVIFIDDGSNPPLKNIFSSALGNFKIDKFRNFKLLEINEKIIWNQPKARNIGAKQASGKYLLFFDIDHMFTKEIIEETISYNGLILKWDRKYGIIDNTYHLNTERKILIENGMPETWGCQSFGNNYNIFAIKKILFDEINGYDESYCGKYGGDDVDFINRMRSLGICDNILGKGLFYAYPNPRKHKDFHKLHRGQKIKN